MKTTLNNYKFSQFSQNFSASPFSSINFTFRKFTTSTFNVISKTINPFFITGLTDGEGSFISTIRMNSSYRMGWRVEVLFQIALHQKDLDLLKEIQAYFSGIGSIVKADKDMYAFKVTSLKRNIDLYNSSFWYVPFNNSKKGRLSFI